MSSRGKLLFYTAVAGFLWVLLIHDRADVPVRADPHLIPELRTGEVAALTVRRGAEVRLGLERRPGGELALAPDQGRVDPIAVGDLLGNLERLSCLRRRDPVTSDPSTWAQPPLAVTLELVSGATIELVQEAPPLPDLGWLWLRRSDQAESCLVNAHAAQALERDAEDLRRRQLFDLGDRSTLGGRDLTGVELHAGARDLVLSGRPLAVHLDHGGAVWVDPKSSSRLIDRLGELVIGSFVERSGELQPPVDALVVRVIGVGLPQELVDLGDCPSGHAREPGDRLVETPIGSGCTSGRALEEIAAFAGRRDELFDRRLIRGKPVEVAVTAGDDRMVLTAHGGGYALAVGETPATSAEAAAVVEWLGALDRVLAAATVAAPVEVPVRTTIDLLWVGGGRDRVWLFRDRRGQSLVRREGESVDWKVDRAAVAPLSPSPLWFRARPLLHAEPFGLRRVIRRRNGQVVEELSRGELLEEWRVVVPAHHHLDPATIADLRLATASLRARAFSAPGAEPRHHLVPPRYLVEGVFDPVPGGAERGPTRHRIALGASTAEGCYVQVDDDPVVAEIDRASCEILAGPWSTTAPP